MMNMPNMNIKDKASLTSMVSPPSVKEWDEPTTLEEPSIVLTMIVPCFAILTR